MAHRSTQRQQLALKLDSLPDTVVQELLDYIAAMESLQHSNSEASSRDDELVTLLANEVESRRARQAYEWEAARRRAAG